MAAIGEKEIKALIRSGDIGGAFLLFGTESYLKEFYSSKLKDKAVSPDFADFNYHFFDGASCTLEDIEQAVEAFPMMSSNTCVFVKDMAVDSLDEDSYEKLEKIVSDVPDYCTLIFYIGKADSLKKTAKAKKAVSLFTKYGNAVELNKKTAYELAKMLVGAAQKRDSSLSQRNAEYLVSCVGDDMVTLLNEIDKLSAYAERREITRVDIDLMCVKTIEANAFDLTKYIISDNFDKAYETLNMLFAQRADVMMIMGAVISVFVDIYRVKVSVSAGYRDTQPAEIFSNYRGREFKLTKVSRQASALSVRVLRQCLDELHRADTLLKSSAVDNRIVMEELLVKLFVAIQSRK